MTDTARIMALADAYARAFHPAYQWGGIKNLDSRDAAREALRAALDAPIPLPADRHIALHMFLKRLEIDMPPELTMSMFASVEDLERARFEAWVTSGACNLIPAGQQWDGIRCAVAWEAWLARSALATKPQEG